jgi:hypothetical protein
MADKRCRTVKPFGRLAEFFSNFELLFCLNHDESAIVGSGIKRDDIATTTIIPVAITLDGGEIVLPILSPEPHHES